MRRMLWTLFFGLGLILLPAGLAHAADFTVNDAGDSADASPGNGVCATAGGKCTLRAAVEEAEALSGTDRIDVPAMTISLSAPLAISRSVQINGASARSTVLTGSPGTAVRIFGGDIVLRDLAISGISGPYAVALYQSSNAATVLERVRVVNNTGTSSSSGYAPVYATAGELTVRDSEVSGNSTSGQSGQVLGSGITVTGANTSLTVENSTIHGNQAWTSNGSATVYGGGLMALTANVGVRSSTITGNTATNEGSLSALGGNIYQVAAVTITDSIIASGSAPFGANCYSSVTMAGRNIVSDDSCGPAGSTVTVADPQLGALGNNGGPTNTRSPSVSSPALNKASACASSKDQRGQVRPIAGACDIGSVELGADLAIKATVSNAKPSAGSDVVFTTVVTNNGMDAAPGSKATVALPGAAGIVSVSPSGGSCTPSGTTVKCNLGTMARSGKVTILAVARAASSGTIAASASTSSSLPDPKPANNSAKVSATVPTAPVTPAGPCSNAIRGTKKADKLKGTAGGDKILGLGRNDVLRGLGGDDCITGGKGKDRIVAGAGNDVIRSRDGVRDVVKCGAGVDRVIADRRDKVAKDCEKVRVK